MYLHGLSIRILNPFHLWYFTSQLKRTIILICAFLRLSWGLFLFVQFRIDRSTGSALNSTETTAHRTIWFHSIVSWLHSQLTGLVQMNWENNEHFPIDSSFWETYHKRWRWRAPVLWGWWKIAFSTPL